ncbi:MAG: zinc ABC transporter substrate-binding protein [Desulfobacterales bacterium]|jgi:zinc transport system substrate-binding protein
MRRTPLFIALACSFIFGLAPEARSNDKLSVFVSIVPQRYFVRQIGKELVDVHAMVPPGADPHTYEPKPRQMVSLATAKLYFAIGIEFEAARLKKILSTNPQIKVVHTDEGIQKISMTEGTHHSGDQHDRNGLDPHIWLSPPLVMMQARTILNALQEVDPVNRSKYEANYKAFMAELVDLDADLKKIFAGRQGLRFMVFHPSWGYFARSYGLVQVPVEIEGKSPKLAQIMELIEHARENNIKIIFVQPQFSSKSAELIAREIGGEVAMVDALAENWSENLREVANKFEAALK